jgi:hypothetical protein
MAETRSTGQMAGRILFTLIGAAGLIVGAFMEWIRDIDGTRLGLEALFERPFQPEAGLVGTVGFLTIALGLLAVVGLATSGWLTRLAGALGIVAFILLLIQLYGAGGAFLPGPGPWLVLTGGVVAVAGGGG